MSSELIFSDIEDLQTRMFDLEHHTFDPSGISGNLQEMVIDHGEWKLEDGFDDDEVGGIEDEITIEAFEPATPLEVEMVVERV